MSADVSQVGAQPRAASLGRSGRATLIASVGNILEWYDFTVYGFLAVIMAKQFFPATDDTVSLLVSFATFGVGFVARPLGAVVFGRLGDRLGRKSVLLLSMFLMAGASFAIGVAPTYAAIGLAAPALIVVARLVQGFSAGGEYGSATAFLVEWAPDHRRGLFGSFHQIGTAGGLLLGSATVALLNAVLPTDAVESWGWRVPFLMGGLLAFVALYMRRNVDETPAYRKARHEAAASAEPVAVPLLQNIGLVALWSVSVFATIVYMPTFTVKFAGLTHGQGLLATTIALAVTVATIPLAGALSDRVGRKAVMGAGALAFCVLTVPLFRIIIDGASFPVVVAVQALFAVCSALVAGPGPACIAELFATRQRSTLVSIGTAVAVTLFGGFAPFIATLLIEKTGSPLSPAFYVVASALITGVTILTLRETARRPLR